MTRIEAAEARYRIAGQLSLDGRAIASCNGSPGGCEYVEYEAVAALPESERAKLVAYDSHAGMWRVCPKHQPTRRHAWMHDVSIEDFMAHAAAADGAFAIDELRRYLPKRHMEYRAR